MKKNFHFSLLMLAVLIVPMLLSGQGNGKITLDDVIKNFTFYPRSVYGMNSMNDGIHYTMAAEGTAIVKYEYETGKAVDTILKPDVMKRDSLPNFDGYNFSNDESRILLSMRTEPIYRFSSKADYYIFTIPSNELKRLSSNGRQQLATFSPDGSMVAFVRDNNLFIVNLLSGEEKKVTTDGRYNYIINGAPDWVYEEEFGFSKAYAWSPDSKKIAYVRFDESTVPMFNMTMYAGQKPELKNNVLYPENRTFRYPKAGESNSLVTVHVYDLKTGADIRMDIGKETDQYIPRIKWTNDPRILCIYRLNRLQNRLELLAAQASTGQSKVFYSEENACYISENNFDALAFLRDNAHFLWLSERDGWNNIYLCSMSDHSVKRIPTGNFDVKECYGIDEDRGVIYYQASELSPVRTEVYSIRIDGTGKKRISDKAGNNSAGFSKKYQYCKLTWSNYATPDYVALYNSQGNFVRVLEDNQDLNNKLKSYSYSIPELFTFITSEGVELNGAMLKPPDFDPANKYPVFMYVYGGPNSQTVIDSWNFGWDNYLAQEGYIVVTVDGRGTGARGEQFRKMTYLQMGKYETIDQVEAAKYLGTLPYVDPERIGIWGWSFGGYLTLMCMTKGEGIFKMGIAVAPVTSWRYYDNIYTERFMRKPQDNPNGYDENSPLNFSDKFQGKLLIIHGTGDDNVHVQNTLEFTERLVQANKDYSVLLYTNRNHGIYGGNTSYHLFRNMTKFILENL
jgi:dipeptidyl-peptidase-4